MLQSKSTALAGVAVGVTVVGALFALRRFTSTDSTTTPSPAAAPPSPSHDDPKASPPDRSAVVAACVSLMGASSPDTVLEKIADVCVTLLEPTGVHWRVTVLKVDARRLVPVAVCNSTRDSLVKPAPLTLAAADIGSVVLSQTASTEPIIRKAPHGGADAMVFAVPIMDSTTNKVLAVIEAVAPLALAPSQFEPASSTLSQVASLGANAVHAVRGHTSASNDLQVPTQYSKLLHSLNNIAHETETVAVIEKVIDSAYALLAAERVSLFLVDSSRKELIVSSSQDVGGRRLPVTRGLAGYVASSGHFLNIADAYEDQRFDPSFDQRTGFVTRSVVGVPIRDRHGGIVGVLQAINRQEPAGKTAPGTPGPYPFQDVDVSVLDVLAAHAGAALRKAQLLADFGRAERKATALLEVVKCNTTELTLDGIVNRVVTAAYALLAADRISLYLVDTVKQELWMAVSKDAVGVRIPLGKGIAGHVASTGTKVNIKDAYADSRFNPAVDKLTGFRTQSVLCMPVTLSGTSQPLAVLQAINKRGASRFDETDEQLMKTFCDEVAFALTRKSVDATLAKMVSDGGTSGETAVNVSLASLFSKGAPEVTLKTSVRLQRATVTSATSWPSGLKASEARDVSAALLDWTFDPFAVSDEELIKDIVAMLHEFELVRRFNIQDQQLQRFILAVQAGYKRDNAFHNFRHAFGTMHATFLVLIHTPASRYLSYLAILSALVAALCHDIGHPGHNNAFEVNSLSPLAIEHSDDAVLERHHAHRTFEILLNAESAIFSMLPKDQFREARQLIIAAILATDMSHHFEMCNELSARIARSAAFRQEGGSGSAGSSSVSSPMRLPPRPPGLARHTSMPEHRSEATAPPSYDRTLREDRLALVRTLVHTADLSGQAFAAPVAKQWGERVVTEFKAQATRERELGLPVAPFMASLGTPGAVAKLQLGFVSNIVLPLWMKVGQLLPGLDPALANLFSNRLLYESQVTDSAAADSEDGGDEQGLGDDDDDDDDGDHTEGDVDEVEEMKSP